MMRLHHKFLMLIVGTILIPLMTAFLMIRFVWGDAGGQSLEHTNFSLAVALERLSLEHPKVGDIAGSLESQLPDVRVYIFDSTRRMIWPDSPPSLVDALPVGTTGNLYSFRQVGLVADDGNTYTVAAGFARADLVNRPYVRLTGLVAVLSLIAFLSLMSLFIIRSISAQIRKLEEATRKISEGDLDFSLEASGSDSIASLTRSFDAMRRRVKEESAARSRFILAISHDLKTPLSGIIGYVDALEDGIALSKEDTAKYVAIIRDKAGLLDSRIRQLIDFVKMETSEWQGMREPVALAPFFGEFAIDVRNEASIRGFSFIAEIEVSGEAIVAMDRDLVSRAIENLFQNAFRYAEPGSSIKFGVRENAASVIVNIADRGAVIPADELSFIFEPFYRGTKSRRETGFGLGLSVVKSVVAAHGWDISVVSDADETSFSIAIPRSCFLPLGA